MRWADRAITPPSAGLPGVSLCSPRRWWLRAIAAFLAFVASVLIADTARAQVITVDSFSCGGVQTADLAAGDTVSVTHSINQTGNFASAIVRTTPGNALLSPVLFQDYVAGTPVTISYVLTTTPVPGTARFAVQFFGNNVLVACPSTPTFTITKQVNLTLISAPGTLTYTIRVANTGSVAMTAPNLADALSQDGAPRVLTSGPTLASGDTNTNGTVDPGETWVYTATYAVPQSGIDDGGDIVNVATFSAANAAAQSASATTSITQTPRIALVKTATLNDGGDGPHAGETVTYTYTASNTGNVTVFDVGVTENAGTFTGTGGLPLPAYDSGGSFSGGAPGLVDLEVGGAPAVFTATYVITQPDIIAGSLVNSADVTGTPPAGGTVTDTSDESSSAVGQNDPTTVALAQLPLLSITKDADNTTNRAAGDVILYTYRVTNTGNVPINGVAITDTHNGSGSPPVATGEVLETDVAPTGDSTDTGTNATWDTLAPGDTVVFTGTYTVTQQDVDLLQ